MKPFLYVIALGICVGCSADSAEDAAVGRKVMVTSWGVEVRANNQETTTLNLGEVHEIGKVAPERVWLREPVGGWISPEDVVFVEEAIDHFTMLVMQDPSAENFCNRGVALLGLGKTERAIRDFSLAVEGEPTDPACYNYRAKAYKLAGEYDKAIAGYTEVIRLAPSLTAGYNNRANTWLLKNDYVKAIADYLDGIAHSPSNVHGLNGLAWLLATCPEAEYRDGPRAVQLARKACEASDYGVYSCLDTLAAAYAETGDYENAVRWAEKAKTLAPLGERGGIDDRLSRYRSGEAYRQTPEGDQS